MSEEKKSKAKDLEAPGIKNIIVCVAVGGGGSNIAKHMYHQQIREVDLVIANTDAQALTDNPIPYKIQLGPNTTHGLGAGAKPEVAEKAAEESKKEIEKIFTPNVKMLFITAGMGGGTGTGAAPVIAELAKEKGLLVIGVVTTPFGFEGKKKRLIAEEGLKRLSKHCDTLIIIENERLLHINKEHEGGRGFGVRSAFALADDVLFKAVTSITDPINKPGVINVDFRDMDTILRGAGTAVMGTGVAQGDNRGIDATQKAVTSPLLRHASIKGASRILLTISSGLERELTLEELSIITSHLENMLENEDVMVIWGHSYEKELKEKIRINVIASGFPEAMEVEETSMERARQPMTSHVVAPLASKGKQVGNRSMEEKVKLWREEAEERLSNIDEEDEFFLTEKEIKDMEVPAYQRKNISLDFVKHAGKKEVLHLDDDSAFLAS